MSVFLLGIFSWLFVFGGEGMGFFILFFRIVLLKFGGFMMVCCVGFCKVMVIG